MDVVLWLSQRGQVHGYVIADHNNMAGLVVFCAVLFSITMTFIFFRPDRIQTHTRQGKHRRKKGEPKQCDRSASELMQPLLGDKEEEIGPSREHANQSQKSRQNGTLRSSTTQETGRAIAPPNRKGLLLCLFVFFVHFYSFAIQETVITPLCQQLYGWGTHNYIYKVLLLARRQAQTLWQEI